MNVHSLPFYLLVGGPAVAGLDPLLFLSCRSGGRRAHRVQRYLESGALACRRGVASGWAWTPSRLLSSSRLRGVNGRCRFRGLLSRRSPGATLSSCWAGALGQEVSHSLWRLLCFCEALSESFHRRSKEAAGGKLEHQGRRPCPHPWSPSAWATGGARALPGWP